MHVRGRELAERDDTVGVVAQTVRPAHREPDDHRRPAMPKLGQEAVLEPLLELRVRAVVVEHDQKRRAPRELVEQGIERAPASWRSRDRGAGASQPRAVVVLARRGQQRGAERPLVGRRPDRQAATGVPSGNLPAERRRTAGPGLEQRGLPHARRAGEDDEGGTARGEHRVQVGQFAGPCFPSVLHGRPLRGRKPRC